jgi:hypothetical protein
VTSYAARAFAARALEDVEAEQEDEDHADDARGCAERRQPGPRVALRQSADERDVPEDQAGRPLRPHRRPVTDEPAALEVDVPAVLKLDSRRTPILPPTPLHPTQTTPRRLACSTSPFREDAARASSAPIDAAAELLEAGSAFHPGFPRPAARRREAA